ncbi:hypothetical protein [Brevundimonas sp. UBA2416]|uniref:hypothetical protein n=1 Tax=Brevundimonas sp. UBA2416 TaxID=1946124 RepID=UPI0025C5419D|nr:hypothetical protein [Brevundimonas sp. UBA2416]HRJ62917.1 hypothetical protein [Brevundimonas sp.]
MKHRWTRQAAIAAGIMICSATGIAPATAEDALPVSTLQFEKIAALAGEWRVQESPSLRIVFEPTAGGSVIVERWMVGERMHSMTVYHLDGERLVATHYCPQGNQPRLVASAAGSAGVRFAFLDATGLDPHESFQHDLSFSWDAEGTVSRAETYRGPEGAMEESSLVLVPAME